MTAYARAYQVQRIAEELIESVPEHENLALARIEYVFRDKAPRSHGRVVLGRARRLSGLAAFLVRAEDVEDGDGDLNRPLFVVEISADWWVGLTPAQQRALVDHELCHLVVELGDDNVPVLSTRGHDLEEFEQIVRRHGLWKSDVESFGAVVVEQLALDVDGDLVEALAGVPAGDPGSSGPPVEIDENGEVVEVPVAYSPAQIAALRALAEAGRLVGGARTDVEAGTVHSATAEALRERGLVRRDGFDGDLRPRFCLTERGRQVL